MRSLYLFRVHVQVCIHK